MREAIYSLRISRGFGSKVKTMIAIITQLEHGLSWRILYSGPIKLDQAKEGKIPRESYEPEILEEEWTGRQEILIIKELIFK